MKTNIFYKVVAVTNSSPKLGEVPQAEEYVRTSATSALTDSLGASATPPNLGGESRYSIRKASVLCTLYSVLSPVLCTLCAVLFLASCTQDDIAPAHPNSPLTITATIPGDVWAVATRAEGEGTVTYSDWTLHYTDYQGQAATGTLTATSSQDGTYSLTSGSDLVWAKVQDTQDADETFHLTCKDSDGATYYATTTAAHGALTVAFTTAMKPSLAKLTVNFTLSHNMAQVDYSDFTISVTAKAAKTSTADEVVYYLMTNQGTWPAAEGDAATTAFTLSQQSVATGTYTVTGSMLLPQQTMGNTMTVKYKETTWTLDLSTVAVTGGEEGKMANELIAGQHLTLNLSTSIHTVDAPSDIQIEAFTAADDYTPDLGGVAKTYEYDAANNTYYIYHEKCIEAALADRAANNRTDAAIVSKAPTLAVVNGADDLATVQAAIAGKSTVIVTGEEVDYIRSAISNSGAAEGSINLILADATEIGENAFQACNALASVSAPKATAIGGYAFFECSTLTSVSAPKATSIGEIAFTQCSALESVSLPDVKEIGMYAFSGCSALTSVSLPAAIEIGDGAFDGCSALTSVELPAATSIGKIAFAFCSVLTSVSLPEATSIGKNAFYNCAALESVSLPAAQTIGDCAFQECIALKSVSLPTAETIGNAAFRICSALTSVSLPAAETIGNSAFNGCTALASVSAPKATLIGENAFDNCTSLTSVSLPDAIEIGIYAFNGCTALTSVSLPEAKSIGEGAFYYCEDLASVSLPEATSIGVVAFGGTSLTSVSLPEATAIGNSAFYGCKALTSVSLPKATTIGDNAFQYCDALTSLTFGTVTSVGTNAFLSASTETCDLTLGTGQEHIADDGTPNGTAVTAGETSWAGKTWKSITLK